MRRTRDVAMIAAFLLMAAPARSQESDAATKHDSAGVAAPAKPQGLDAAAIGAKLDSTGVVTLARSGVTLLRYDYVVNGDSVEAIVSRPAGEGKHPGVVLIPGYQRSARDYLPFATRMAHEGFTTLAISQPGFGRSQGEPDFVGPRTMAAIVEGIRLWRAEPYVDGDHWGVLGYSRGAMAASLLAVSDTTLDAAVFAAGIYDFKRAHARIPHARIRENMELEAGLSDSAAAVRSSLPRMASLRCPVLVLHGAQDTQAPVDQAYALRDRLQSLGKTFDIEVVKGKAHDLGMDILWPRAIAFFKKWLATGG